MPRSPVSWSNTERLCILRTTTARPYCMPRRDVDIPKVVKLLLRQGADVDVLNKAGRSAAELASENGQAEVAKFISEYKANANTQNLQSTTLDKNRTVQMTMERRGKGFCCSCRERGEHDTVGWLLERGSGYQCSRYKRSDSVTQSRDQGERQCRVLAHRAGRGGGFT